MSSDRLPGKVLRSLAGRLVVERVFRQLSMCQNLSEIVLATSQAPSDDALAEWAQTTGRTFFRGSLMDVLGRIYGVAQSLKLGPQDSIVRITADCPLIEPRIVDQVVAELLRTGCDYCSNIETRRFPDGYDVEAMKVSALGAAFREAELDYDREHVTPYLRQRGDRFRIGSVTSDHDRSHWRLTLDDAQDFHVLDRLIVAVGANRDCIYERDIVSLLQCNAELACSVIQSA